DIRWQSFHRFIEPLLHVFDHLTRVRAVTHHHDSARRFAFAVQFRDTAPHVGTKLHVGHFPEQDRDAAFADADRNFFQVLNVLHITAHAQNELLLRHFDRAPADLAVAAAHSHFDIADRQVVSAQFCRIDSNLVLFYEATDACDFGDTFYRRKLVTKIPILHRTKLGQAALL